MYFLESYPFCGAGLEGGIEGNTMKTYTVFIIPERDFPNNIVIKRWRGKHTDDKLKKRGYDHFAYFEVDTKKEALELAKKKCLIEGIKK